MDGGRLIGGTNRAAPAAFGSPEAGGATFHGFADKSLGLGITRVKLGRQIASIQPLGQHGAMRGDYANSQSACMFLDQQVTDARLGRRLQHT